ncbi:hypothetical protein BN2476_110057 [Paraburkholderia piptadeniae]|uniref:Uncharacterized protein n=1 Tax=Paraburkholderia piptadeniae TaxID=1701573 RepID=A0A1N7RPG7_9BURK|nr:hypothetical protein BN2476_110057 [Paraburkholderia piptadeniae]
MEQSTRPSGHPSLSPVGVGLQRNTVEAVETIRASGSSGSSGVDRQLFDGAPATIKLLVSVLRLLVVLHDEFVHRIDDEEVELAVDRDAVLTRHKTVKTDETDARVSSARRTRRSAHHRLCTPITRPSESP